LAEAVPASWVIERLSKQHDRAGFSCGVPILDEWLKLRASQYEKKDLARTYVAVQPAESVVQGYYDISSHRVSFDALPEDQAKGLPRIDVPVILLGRLAVDGSVQGQGLGAHLLIDALRRAQHVANLVGIRAVEVDAIDDSVRRFYLKYGFTPLLDDSKHLFLPMQAIRKLGLPPLG
jgi:GNAT superfamily N-acetyltransferase